MIIGLTKGCYSCGGYADLFTGEATKEQLELAHNKWKDWYREYISSGLKIPFISSSEFIVKELNLTPIKIDIDYEI